MNEGKGDKKANDEEANESVSPAFASSDSPGSEFETREVPVAPDDSDERETDQVNKTDDGNESIQRHVIDANKPGSADETVSPMSEVSDDKGGFRVVVSSRRPGSILDTSFLDRDDRDDDTAGDKPVRDEFDTVEPVSAISGEQGSDSETVAVPSEDINRKRGVDDFDDLETREVPILKEEWKERAAEVASQFGEGDMVDPWDEASGGDATLAASVAAASGELPIPPDQQPTSVAALVLKQAAAAQQPWAALRFEQRMPPLDALRNELVRQRNDYVPSLATAISRPMVETLTGEYLPVLEALRTLEDVVPPLLVERHSPGAPLLCDDVESAVRMSPWGVVVIANSANSPFAFPLGLAVDALATGNAVVLCMNEEHPRLTEMAQRLFQRAGLPESLVQVVAGAPDMLEALVEAGAHKVIFQGDEEQAARLASRAVMSGTEFQYVQERKDIALVLGNAALDRATHAVMWGAFAGGGLLPGSIERVVVASSQYDEFRMRLIEALRVMNSHHAQLANIKELFNPGRFQKLVQDAVAGGARVTWPAGETPGRWIHWKSVVVEGVSDKALLSHHRFEGPGVALYRAEEPLDEVRRLLRVAPASNLCVLGEPDRDLKAQLESMPVARVAFHEPQPGAPASSGWPLGPEMPRSLCGVQGMLRPKVVATGDPVAGRVAWFPYTDDKAYALMEAIEAHYSVEFKQRLRAQLKLSVNGQKRRLLNGDNS